MKKYGLQVKFTALPGKADKLTELLLNASSLVATAHGCQFYVIGRDNTNENLVLVTEIWDSRDDHANSLHVEGVRELIEQVMPQLNGRPERIQELDIIGGVGLA